MSEQREFIRVRKVDNGYIVTCDAPGSHGRVAKNGAEVVDIVADILGVTWSPIISEEMSRLLLSDRVCQAMAEAKAEVATLMQEWESLAYGAKEAQ